MQNRLNFIIFAAIVAAIMAGEPPVSDIPAPITSINTNTKDHIVSFQNLQPFFAHIKSTDNTARIPGEDLVFSTNLKGCKVTDCGIVRVVVNEDWPHVELWPGALCNYECPQAALKAKGTQFRLAWPSMKKSDLQGKLVGQIDKKSTTNHYVISDEHVRAQLRSAIMKIPYDIEHTDSVTFFWKSNTLTVAAYTKKHGEFSVALSNVKERVLGEIRGVLSPFYKMLSKADA